MRTRSLSERVSETLERHPAVRRVVLTGSRADGRATDRSDWDFLVQTDDFDAVARALPELVEPLGPLAQQWDRLSDTWCFMIMVPGPAKIDLIFERPHPHDPPWRPDRKNLVDIDRHFWDWMLWLRSKEAKGADAFVATELDKLFAHLLGPMGVPAVPNSIADAVSAYREARDQLERRFHATVPRHLERAVLPVAFRYD